MDKYEKKLKLLTQRVNVLEDTLEDMKVSKKGGYRLEEMANFILNYFKEEKTEWLPVDRIVRKGETLGYSPQMLQRAKRYLLRGKVTHCRAKGDNSTWMWTTNKDMLEDME